MNTAKSVFLACSLAAATFAQTPWDSHFQAGLVHYRSGRVEAAIRAWRSAAGEAKAFAATDPRVGRTWNNLAAAESAAGRYDDAESSYGRVLATWHGRSLDLEAAKTLNNLASLHRVMGRLSPAAEEASRAWGIATDAAASRDRDVTLFHILFNQAEIARAEGDLGSAESSTLQLLAMAAGLGDTRLEASAIQLKAGLLSARGAWIPAEIAQRQAMDLFAQAVQDQHPARVQAADLLGQILMAQGKLDEARPHLEAALAAYEMSLGAEHPQVATALFNLARWKRERGERVGVDSLLRRAIGIWTLAYGPRHPQLAIAWRELALHFLAAGKVKGAEELLQRALKVSEEVLGANHTQTRAILFDLVQLYRAQQRLTAAARVESRLQTAAVTNSFVEAAPQTAGGSAADRKSGGR